MSFTEESAMDIFRSIPYSEAPKPQTSSRLLNRQVKYIMHKLHRELTETVLRDLEKSLRSRTKDSWAPSFCAILLLCLCIESLQTAVHTMVVCELQRPDPDPQCSGAQSRDACLALDEYPFQKCKKLFHEIYRTHKEGGSGVRDGGFNPLIAVHKGSDTHLDPAADEMVRSVYRMISSNGEYLLPECLQYGI